MGGKKAYFLAPWLFCQVSFEISLYQVSQYHNYDKVKTYFKRNIAIPQQHDMVQMLKSWRGYFISAGTAHYSFAPTFQICVYKKSHNVKEQLSCMKSFFSNSLNAKQRDRYMSKYWVLKYKLPYAKKPRFLPNMGLGARLKILLNHVKN